MSNYFISETITICRNLLCEVLTRGGFVILGANVLVGCRCSGGIVNKFILPLVLYLFHHLLFHVRQNASLSVVYLIDKKEQRKYVILYAMYHVNGCGDVCPSQSRAFSPLNSFTITTHSRGGIK